MGLQRQLSEVVLSQLRCSVNQSIAEKSCRDDEQTCCDCCWLGRRFYTLRGCDFLKGRTVDECGIVQEICCLQEQADSGDVSQTSAIVSSEITATGATPIESMTGTVSDTISDTQSASTDLTRIVTGTPMSSESNSTVIHDRVTRNPLIGLLIAGRVALPIFKIITEVSKPIIKKVLKETKNIFFDVFKKIFQDKLKDLFDNIFKTMTSEVSDTTSEIQSTTLSLIKIVTGTPMPSIRESITTLISDTVTRDSVSQTSTIVSSEITATGATLIESMTSTVSDTISDTQSATLSSTGLTRIVTGTPMPSISESITTLISDTVTRDGVSQTSTIVSSEITVIGATLIESMTGTVSDTISDTQSATLSSTGLTRIVTGTPISPELILSSEIIAIRTAQDIIKAINPIITDIDFEYIQAIPDFIIDLIDYILNNDTVNDTISEIQSATLSSTGLTRTVTGTPMSPISESMTIISDSVTIDDGVSQTSAIVSSEITATGATFIESMTGTVSDTISEIHSGSISTSGSIVSTAQISSIIESISTTFSDNIVSVSESAVSPTPIG